MPTSKGNVTSNSFCCALPAQSSVAVGATSFQRRRQACGGGDVWGGLQQGLVDGQYVELRGWEAKGNACQVRRTRSVVLSGKATAGAASGEGKRSMWLLPSHWAHFGTQSSPPPNPLRTDAWQPVLKRVWAGGGGGGHFSNGLRVKSEVFVLKEGQTGDGRWGGRDTHCWVAET